MSNKEKQTKKSKRLTVLVPILIFMIGAGIFLYPALSNYINTLQHNKTIQTYQAKLAETDQAELDALWNAANAYNDQLAGETLRDPFVPGSGYVLPEHYENVLNPQGDGVMGYIEIDKIDVRLPIYHGTSEEVLKQGVGHIEFSSLPIGGLNRHCVLSAHRGLPSSLLFTHLDKMEIGDQFYIHVLNEVHAYQVDSIETILPEEISFLHLDPNQDWVTLLTCTPYGVNTHRLLVRGHRVEYVEPTVQEEQQSSSFPKWLQEYIVSIGIGLFILLLLIIIWIVRKKRKGNE
ncbi:MAG: class C sortase [Erysipelotrichaceae bacterium]|nr:class C sortase [Erysipelotrichaceae bacterium]